MLKHDLKKTEIDFRYNGESEYLTVQVDTEMIEQVLINLVKNAIEALENTPKARIEVVGRYQNNSVLIEVIDNGPGIIPEAIERIFIPFFTTKKRYWYWPCFIKANHANA
ncbi:MAG: ATP-binding protein [Cytophagales bacterium]|nr:ATP-binding protein [Cytophagales bacterium]